MSSPTEFAEAWPAVRKSLVRRLSRKVGPDVAEDLCQEVALRAVSALSDGLTFASGADLRRWVNEVARCRLIDYWRARAQGSRAATLLQADPSTSIPPEQVVVLRAALEEVTSALPLLRPDLRASLVGVLGEAPLPRDSIESEGRRWRRQKARAQLRGMVHNFPGALGPLGRIRERLPLWSTNIDAGQVLAGIGVSIAILVSPHSIAPPRGAHVPSPTAVVPRASVELAPALAVAGDPLAARQRREALLPPRTVTTARELAASSPYWNKTTDHVSVSDPVGTTSVSEYDEPADDPLVCVQAGPSPWLCVHDDDPDRPVRESSP